MSFRDLDRRKHKRVDDSVQRRIIVQQPHQEGSSRPSAGAAQSKSSRRFVLHGKVHMVGVDSEEEEDVMEDESSVLRARQDSIRRVLQRRSEFSKLSHETQQYSKMVSDLVAVLEESGESPAAAWRAKILAHSARETDKDLWAKLFQYETTLGQGRDEETRTAQTSCMKLHRDFKRSHKTLLMALTTFEKRQAAEVSRLGAVGWSGIEDSNGGEAKEDFYDRAMRERDEELKRMNQSMKKVGHIYKDLATLVETQQEQIDTLDDDIAYARGNVEATANSKGCMPNAFNDMYLCGALGVGAFDLSKGDWEVFSEYDQSVTLDEEKSTDSSFTRNTVFQLHGVPDLHWYTPFQTFPEDMKSVRKDLFGLGRAVIAKGKKLNLECTSNNRSID